MQQSQGRDPFGLVLGESVGIQKRSRELILSDQEAKAGFSDAGGSERKSFAEASQVASKADKFMVGMFALGGDRREVVGGHIADSGRETSLYARRIPSRHFEVVD